MSSLDDAWRWYESVKTLTEDMARLGRRYWDRAEWADPLGRDNRFRDVDSSDIAGRVNTVLGGQDGDRDLEDLGVLLLFSIFEAIVRDLAQSDVKKSLPQVLHPAVEHAIKGLINDIESGSFGKVTQAFKGMDADLIEEVNQVRRYRNWVAHGRRGDQPAKVDPRLAYDRLNRFLERMADAAGQEP
jgi:hypothetical protein